MANQEGVNKPDDTPQEEEQAKRPPENEENAAAPAQDAAGKSPASSPTESKSRGSGAETEVDSFDALAKGHFPTAQFLHDVAQQVSQGVLLGDNSTVENLTFHIYKNEGDQKKIVDRMLDYSGSNLQPVDHRDFERILKVFVAPQIYNRAAEILRQENIVVLYGESGTGKNATAIHLMGAQNLPEDLILLTYPMQKWEELASLEMNRRVGLIFENASVEFLQQLNEYRLRELKNRLRAQKSCLIITTAALDVLRIPAFLDVRVNITFERTPDALKSFIMNHIDFQLSSEPKEVYAKAVAAYESEEVQQIVSEIRYNRDLRPIADALASVARGLISLEHFVNSYSSINESERSIWLDTFRDPREWPFLLSMAVFQRERREYIEYAADLLRSFAPEIFDPQPTEDEPARPLQPVSDLYRRSRIHREFLDRYDTLVFDKVAYGTEVLHYFWLEYPALHDVICKWLTKIVKSDSSIFSEKATVQILQKEYGTAFDKMAGIVDHFDKASKLKVRVAHAVGQLALRRNFDRIEQNILLPWIQTGNVLSQYMVGIAIGIPALQDEKFAEVIMQTLQEWSTSGDGRYKRTAALAYGILGRKYKTEALKSLREIADRVSKSPQRSFAVYDSIVNSLRIIFTYGNDDSAFYGLVLIALREWAQSQETPAISQIALLTFVLIAGSDGTQKNGDEWLTVLAYTHSHSRLRGVVVSLLARAITEQSTRSIAIDVLRAWCKHATDISNSERVVYTLIQLLWDNSSGFDRDRLLYYLHSWSTDRELGVFVRKVVNALTSPRN